MILGSTADAAIKGAVMILGSTADAAIKGATHGYCLNCGRDHSLEYLFWYEATPDKGEPK